jgi:hypothetical protein
MAKEMLKASREAKKIRGVPVTSIVCLHLSTVSGLRPHSHSSELFAGSSHAVISVCTTHLYLYLYIYYVIPTII